LSQFGIEKKELERQFEHEMALQKREFNAVKNNMEREVQVRSKESETNT